MSQISPKDLTALNEAQRRLRTGDPIGAIKIAEGVAQAVPKYPSVHSILARAYRTVGKTELALSHYRAAAELAGNDPNRWTDFVAAMIASGQKGRARNVAKKAPLKGAQKKKLMDLAKRGPSTEPDTGGVPPSNLMALQDLIRKGLLRNAGDMARSLLQSYPRSAVLLNVIGASEMAEGDLSSAETHLRNALRISPDFVGAATNLGLALVRQNRISEAISTLKHAVTLEPNSVEARKNLAIACLENRLFSAAEENIDALLRIAKDDPDGLALQATVARELKRFDDALEAIDLLERVHKKSFTSVRLRFETLADSDRTSEAIALIKANPNSSRALRANGAKLYAQLGDLGNARAEMTALIDEDVTDPEAYYLYGLYTRWTDSDPYLPGLRNAAAKADKNSEAGTSALFALAKAEIDLANDEAAFEALKTANENSPRSAVYDFAGEERQRKEIQSKWTRESLERIAEAGDDTVAPIFIVGTPRSGSTLIENIVSAHPQVVSVGEETLTGQFFPFDMDPDRTAIGTAARDTALEFRRAMGACDRLVDKYLHNYWRLGLLAAAFPSAHFIETRRDPRAIAFSIYSNHMGERHAYAMDLATIAEFYINYRALMDHWHRVLGDRLILADYDRIVASPEPEIRGLISRLGLPWDPLCLRPESVGNRVKTLSVSQVRSGIHTSSKERWRRFEDQLAPFTERLAEAGLASSI